jgi:hypothetical protein
VSDITARAGHRTQHRTDEPVGDAEHLSSDAVELMPASAHGPRRESTAVAEQWSSRDGCSPSTTMKVDPAKDLTGQYGKYRDKVAVLGARWRRRFSTTREPSRTQLLPESLSVTFQCFDPSRAGRGRAGRPTTLREKARPAHNEPAATELKSACGNHRPQTEMQRRNAEAVEHG